MKFWPSRVDPYDRHVEPAAPPSLTNVVPKLTACAASSMRSGWWRHPSRQVEVVEARQVSLVALPDLAGVSATPEDSLALGGEGMLESALDRHTVHESRVLKEELVPTEVNVLVADKDRVRQRDPEGLANVGFGCEVDEEHPPISVLPRDLLA